MFYPTLDEIATEDEDNDGITGEGAIDGHVMDVDVIRLKVDYWIYDCENEEYIDEGGITEMDVTPDTNPVIAYGIRVNDLFDVDTVTEQPSGRYINTQTVYDYYYYDGDVMACITVLEYVFDFFDMGVYKWSQQ